MWSLKKLLEEHYTVYWQYVSNTTGCKRDGQRFTECSLVYCSVKTFNISLRTVHIIIKRFREYGEITVCKGQGR